MGAGGGARDEGRGGGGGGGGRGEARGGGASQRRPESGVTATSSSAGDPAGDANAYIYTCPIGGMIAGVSSGLLGGIIGSGACAGGARPIRAALSPLRSAALTGGAPHRRLPPAPPPAARTAVKGLVRKDKGFGRLASSWRQSKSMGKVRGRARAPPRANRPRGAPHGR